MGKLTLSNSNGHHCMNELHPMESRQLLLSVISKIDKIHLNENNTIYRAEGNANLVLSMPDTKRVVRLRKSFIDDILNKGTTDNTSYELKRAIDYIKFLSSLVGDSFAIQPEMVYLEIYDYEFLNNWLMKFRPADRLEKIIKCQYGTLYPDVTFLPDELNVQKTLQQENNKTTMKTYCIEIKPKQGWLLEKDFCSESSEIFSLLEYDEAVKCRYCMLQYYKLEKGLIKRISKYCPVDLFSGNPYRMVRALKGLAKSPQNNFRFFENGNIIYDEKCDKKSLFSCLNNLFGYQKTNKENINFFANLLRETLLKDFTKIDCDSSKKVYHVRKNKRKKKVHVHLKWCDRNNSTDLPENCALKKLLDVQLLAKSSLSHITSAKFKEIYTNNHNYTYIDDILQKVNNINKIFKSMPSTTIITEKAAAAVEKNNSKVDLVDWYLKKLNDYEKYVLGATALDSSIMITFRKLAKHEVDLSDEEIKKHTISIGNINFLTNVTIMDLDPKATTHYDKMIQQLNASHVAYKNFIRTKLNF